MRCSHRSTGSRRNTPAGCSLRREVRPPLHQDRFGESWSRRVPICFLNQDLLGWRGRVPGGHALHGDLAERGCHAVPLPPGLRGDPTQLEPRGHVDVLGALRRHSPPLFARRTMRRVRVEQPLRGLPRQGLWDDRRSDGRRPSLTPHTRHVRRVTAAGHPGPCGCLRGASPGSIWTRVAADDRVGRCRSAAYEEGPRVRPGHGRKGRRGLVQEGRPRPRHCRRARENPRANADAEDVWVAAAAGG